MTAIATRKVLAQSFRFVGNNINHVATAAFIPVVLYTGLGTVSDLLTDDLQEGQNFASAILWPIVTGSFELLFVPFFVGWHRITLLASATVRFRTFFDAGPRDVRYCLYLLIALLSIYAFEISVTAITGGSDLSSEEAAIGITAVSVVAIFLFLWLSVSLAFLLVETAVDQPTSLTAGWRAGRGHRWPLLILFVCISAVQLLLSGFVIAAEFGFYGDADPGPWFICLRNLFMAALTAVFGAIWVSAMSYAYRDATGYVPPDVDTLF